jgi:SMC interacting uncharacterized protein involved in chromosome segregation
MEQCPFCREPEKFIELFDKMAKEISSNHQRIEQLKSKIDGLARVDRHMEYLRRELTEFKRDRKDFAKAVRAFIHHVKLLNGGTK